MPTRARESIAGGDRPTLVRAVLRVRVCGRVHTHLACAGEPPEFDACIIYTVIARGAINSSVFEYLSVIISRTHPILFPYSVARYCEYRRPPWARVQGVLAHS